MNNTQTEEKILQVPIEDIIPNRFQPRLAFDDASLSDLAASIKQHGIIQPLVLRRKNDKYEIVAGERRYKAARMAGLVSVPAIISNLSDAASAEVAIVENIQRKDLSAIEEARSYQSLLEKGYMTQEELAKKMGLSQSAVSNKLRLLTLDESVQQAVIKEQISERHARSLLKIKDFEMQKVLLNKIITERLTVKQLEDEIKKITPVQNIPSPISNIESVNPTTKNLGTDTIDNINNMLDIAQMPPKTESIEEIEPIEQLSQPTEVSQSAVNDVDDIPVINSIPNIENIKNNSVDIKSLNASMNSPQNKGGVEMNDNNVSTTSPVFGNPEKAPNKFFNFLESQAANLNLEEAPKTFELPKVEEEKPKPTELLNQTDNIEMLDDFIIPSSPTNGKVMNNDYLDGVIKTIRGLNFDSDKVTIEEINLPTEYHITIKIKKDKI